jgi:predicted dehydrogenase
MRGFKNILTVSRSHPLMDKFWVDQGGGFAWEYTFINEVHHLADCIVNDKSISPQGATFIDGYRNCLIMDAMVQSAKEERWVNISQDNP